MGAPQQQADADTAAASAFVQRWQGTTASELSTAQSFVTQLCELLGVDAPHPTPEQAYMFERPITFSHGDGSTSAGRIDCYRRGHFVLEAKKLKAGAHTKGFDDALLRARAQAEGYARALPAVEGRPPFLMVVDVGNVIELYAEFTRSGATYTPFPDPRSHRLALADLIKPEVRERLALIWTDPESLNPARASARVTREVAAQLAELAKSLELSGHKPDHVAAFLTRSLFSMFAEDVELLPKGSFLGVLQTHREQPATLQQMLRVLWADMDQGGFSATLATKVLQFNGKLFKQPASDGYSLLLNQEQIDQLIVAARSNWREVEPAIFGTLLERALNTTERHALGAHYTPRAYVERLVLPTVVEPLRADWANAQAAAVVLALEAAELTGKAHDSKMAEARAEIRKFHHQLCTTRVLDPACGSGNFLYVTLEHLKRLEGEVLNQLEALGETQSVLGLEGETVTPQQLLGIELNERAVALAELVLWIGYLQWHIRTRGNKAVAEPVVHDYGNIEHRDAVLESDESELAYDDGPNGTGELLTRWDGVTFKPHPATGALVPDEAAQVPQWKYINARKAPWPQADFIVGNPPFIGNKRMREALGDGYAQALRAAWPEVPESADFVMYWWAHAAALVNAGAVRHMGLITTNSLTMIFNRRVVEAGLAGTGAGSAGSLILASLTKSAPNTAHPGAGAASLVFAIPDHPWVDSANGAAVRIAMTVLAAGARDGELLTVAHETPGEHGEVDVTFSPKRGIIHADLTTGADLTAAHTLLANSRIANRGVIPHGAGFILTPDEARALGWGTAPGLDVHIRDYRNGKDLADQPRGVKVIDLHGLASEEVRSRFPAVYQWLLERVKPERELNNRQRVRELWWLFAEARTVMRSALAGLPRYIATGQVAKHRTFQFLDRGILPDDKLIAIALPDDYSLGVLSSRVHVEWALATGGHLGVGNDPVYSKSKCFDTFPFPDEDTGLTPELHTKIASLAEQIDAHRKRALGQMPSEPPATQNSPKAGQPGSVGSDLASAASMSPPQAPAAPPSAGKNATLTGIYNVLETLREGRNLTDKEKHIHTQALVGVLKDLHDELDAAVAKAYGWADLSNGAPATDELLTRLVALNAKRAAEEKQGQVRWLRPEFQNPAVKVPSDEALQNKELLTHSTRGLQAYLALENDQKPAKPGKSVKGASTGDVPATATPWPATLPEQVRALAAVLAASTAPLAVADIEARFKGKGPWKKGLPRILETLEALGRARREETATGTGWRG